MSGGGSPHLHSQFVLGCFRCALSRDEADAAIRDELIDERDEARAKLAAVRELVAEKWGPEPQASVPQSILAILDGQSGG